MASRAVDTDLIVDGEVYGDNIMMFIDIGATAGAARTAGTGIQYWICNNGIVPTNAVEGDLIYNRSV
jgi:hypothetical protein